MWIFLKQIELILVIGCRHTVRIIKVYLMNRMPLFIIIHIDMYSTMKFFIRISQLVWTPGADRFKGLGPFKDPTVVEQQSLDLHPHDSG